MDTSIDNLIKVISKKKDKKINNLKIDLEICENRIKELKEEIKKLQADKPVDDYVKAAYNEGYGVAMGKMIAFLNKIKSEPTVDTEARQKLYQYDFQKASDENPGISYYKPHLQLGFYIKQKKVVIFQSINIFKTKGVQYQTIPLLYSKTTTVLFPCWSKVQNES